MTRTSSAARPEASGGHVRAEYHGGRVLVYVERRQARCFSLSLAEAHELWSALGALPVGPAPVLSGGSVPRGSARPGRPGRPR